MASTKVAPVVPDPHAALVHLVEVANQVETSVDVNKESASKARGMRAWVNFLRGEGTEVEGSDELTFSLGPWGEELVKLGAIEGDVISIANDLEGYANLLAPKASELWDQTEVKNSLNLCEAMEPFGVFSDEEKVTLAHVAEVLSSARKGSGTRAERTPQPIIEGRPNFIVTTYLDGENNVVRLGCNGGNRANSKSNIKNAVVKFINKNMPTGQSLTESQVKEIDTAVTNAISTGKATSAIGMTFTPSDTEVKA